MKTEKISGIPYTPLPPDLQSIEREKSRFLLEAHMLKSQNLFSEAAERFAQAAQHEEKLANWAAKQGLNDLSYLHAFSTLSCWAQAGDPHRALEMSQALLCSKMLTDAQRAQLQAYHETLEQRWISWMQQWSPPVFSPA